MLTGAPFSTSTTAPHLTLQYEQTVLTSVPIP
jgi:hypothetical protein